MCFFWPPGEEECSAQDLCILTPPRCCTPRPEPGPGATGCWCAAHSLEPLGGEEVQEVEEFLQVVLQRGSRQQQLVLQGVVVEDPEELTDNRVRELPPPPVLLR